MENDPYLLATELLGIEAQLIGTFELGPHKPETVIRNTHPKAQSIRAIVEEATSVGTLDVAALEALAA